MRIKQTFFIVCCFFMMVVTAATAAERKEFKTMWEGKKVYMVRKADNFILLYDRSGSMEAPYVGTLMTELAAERKILVEKNATLPDMHWQAGIYSFTPGHALTDLTVFYPMQPYNKRRFSRTISKMPREPMGPTLLQQGLYGLDSVLAGLSGKTVIFLFTDGQYTPVDHLRPPQVQAKRLAEKYDICFVVINTGEKKKGYQAIKAISEVNDCSYMIPFSELLGNPEWMTSALFSVVDTKPKNAKEVLVGHEWQNILFDFDKYNIKNQYLPILAKVAAFMKEYPSIRIVLAGHTDNIGTREYNLKLSHRRAASVRDYLVKVGGIDKNRITLNGFGYDKPIASNKTAEGRAQNRRVQGLFIGF